MTGHPDPDDVAIVVRGIDLAVWNLPQVAAWADTHISAADAAPSWLLECSLSKHILDARRALLTVASASSLLADDDLALALVGHRLMSGAITPREATRAAFAVVRGQTTGSLVDAVYHLDDGFDLADARIAGTADEVPREAMRFFGETVQQTAGGARLREFLQAEGRLLEGHGAAEQGVEAAKPDTIGASQLNSSVGRTIWRAMRPTGYAVAVVLGSACLTSCHGSRVQPLISGSLAEPYVEEFLAVETQYPHGQPDHDRVSLGASELVRLEEPGIPLIGDGCHSVWLSSPLGRKRILKVREGDPGSGVSFGFSWSKDGQAAFIIGGHSGIDCTGPVAYARLRIIYTLADDVAWEVPSARGRPTRS